MGRLVQRTKPRLEPKLSFQFALHLVESGRRFPLESRAGARLTGADAYVMSPGRFAKSGGPRLVRFARSGSRGTAASSRNPVAHRRRAVTVLVVVAVTQAKKRMRLACARSSVEVR